MGGELKGINTLYCPATIKDVIALGTDVNKALWISLADWGTLYDYSPKVFYDAKKALAAYRNFKKVTKYKIQFSRAWAFYQCGRLTWLPRKVKDKFE